MLVRVLISWAVLTVAVGVAAAAVPSVEIEGGLGALVLVAAVLGLVTALIGPVLKLLSLPLTVVTLGLFSLVVNGLLLAIAAGLSEDLDVGGPISVIVGALLISVIAAVLHRVLDPE